MPYNNVQKFYMYNYVKLNDVKFQIMIKRNKVFVAPTLFIINNLFFFLYHSLIKF